MAGLNLNKHRIVLAVLWIAAGDKLLTSFGIFSP
jgi:hypothetical protein